LKSLHPKVVVGKMVNQLLPFNHETRYTTSKVAGEPKITKGPSGISIAVIQTTMEVDDCNPATGWQPL